MRDNDHRNHIGYLKAISTVKVKRSCISRKRTGPDDKPNKTEKVVKFIYNLDITRNKYCKKRKYGEIGGFYAKNAIKTLLKPSNSYTIDIHSGKRNLKCAPVSSFQRLFIFDGTICLLLKPYDPAIFFISIQKLHSQICEMDTGSWLHRSYTETGTTAGT